MYFLVTKISPERSRFWYLGPFHAVDVKKISTGSFKLTFLLFLRDEHLDNTLLMPCTPRLLKHAQNKAALINGTVKRAAKTASCSCWKAMLRVLPPTNQTCLATNQVVVNSEKFLQKLKSSSAFCNKKCTCLRALLAQGPPRKTCLVTTDVTPVVYHFHG